MKKNNRKAIRYFSRKTTKTIKNSIKSQLITLIAFLFTIFLTACSPKDKKDNSNDIQINEVILKLDIINPSFEQTNNRNNPVKWFFSQHAGIVGYESKIDNKEKFEGEKSVYIKQIENQVYGSITQKVSIPEVSEHPKSNETNNKTRSEQKTDNTPAKELSLTFSAQIKSDQVGENGAYLSVNFLDANGHIISQVKSEPTKGTHDWKSMTLTKEIPERTKKVSLSIILTDKGTVWIDDVDGYVRIVN